jgi:hypothetical protein
MVRTAVGTLVILLVCSFASAEATIYSSESSFVSQLSPGYYEETFASLPSGSTGGTSLPFASNGFAYTISVGNPLSTLYVVSDGMSSFFNTDTIMATFTGNPVTAVGGFFFATDFSGAPINGNMTLTLNNGISLTYYADANTTFVGFTLAAPITSLAFYSVDGLAGNTNYYPTFTDFYVGAAMPIPGALLLFGPGLIGLAAIRRTFTK